MDFFAGSGTTAEAVLSANAEDGGTRRFIVVQLPEAINAESPAGQAGYKSIAELTLARTKSANQRYKVNSRARGVKAFKLAASNITSWNPDKTDIEATLLNHTESLVEGRSEQDILYELLLKRGVELTVPIEEKTDQRKNHPQHWLWCYCLPAWTSLSFQRRPKPSRKRL